MAKKLSLLFIIFFTLILCLIGCQPQNNTPTLSAGFYCTPTVDESSNPAYISLDTEKNEFVFGASITMSYAEYGTYTIKKDKLIAVSQNATFTFEVKDEKTLVLIDKGTDEYFKFPVGTQFILKEEWQ